MTFHRYKDKIVKGLAILLASLMILGALAPVVFADEPTEITEENNGNEYEDNDADGENNGPENPVEEVKPLVWNISLYPESRDEDDWFNENTLYHRIRGLYYRDLNNDGRRMERLFVRMDFTVDEGELTFSNINNLIAGVGVYSDNSNISMVDVDFLNEIYNMTTNNEDTGKNEQQEFIDRYIFSYNTTDKTRATLYVPIKPLMSHMKYTVRLSPGVVEVTNTTRPNTTNETRLWTFNTMAVPSIGEADVIVQSILEDYDVTEPIIINGKFLDRSVEVFFNDIRAYRVNLREDGNQQYLEVYLPRGRNKLEAGLYSIIIQNSGQHVRELYGTLSVVPSSGYRLPPTEDFSYGVATPYGNVSGLRRGEIIRLDHLEPFKEQTLRNSLQGYILRSPIVEISSSNTNLSRFSAEIPMDNGQYEKYKVLRYNDVSRLWEEESSYLINVVDQKADILTYTTGIYVVVEPKY
ncbi:hypothetical protein [Alkaliphilus sp. B6464]|uniref:hypothetical protein n=1 Tax=Alkaliphilus sp. B6464 TaxID=2731219 RepID=UPI001BADED67|nr:hypothetical protein [Alkaliphilus sp. B6464]QUH19147.1 hypothetical protein HYG84_04080 [Alkaliphilus sp. B6464]